MNARRSVSVTWLAPLVAGVLAAGACASPARTARVSPVVAPPRPRGWAAVRGWSGHWTGTWHTLGSGREFAGTAEFDVSERGDVRGVLFAAGYRGQLGARLRPSGRLEGAVYVPSVELTLRIDGSCDVDPQRHAAATLEVFVGELRAGRVQVEIAQIAGG